MVTSEAPTLGPSDKKVEQLWQEIAPQLRAPRRWRSSVVIALSLGAFALGGTAVAAATAISPQVQSVIVGEYADESEAYAAEFGVSKEEAAEDFELQAQAGSTLRELREAAGERLIGVSFVRNPRLAIQVLITSGRELASLESISATSPVPVIVEYLYAPSAEEMQAAVDDHSETWGNLVPDLQGIYVSETDARIELMLGGDPSNSDAIVATLRKAGLGQLPVHLNFSDGVAGD